MYRQITAVFWPSQSNTVRCRLPIRVSICMSALQVCIMCHLIWQHKFPRWLRYSVQACPEGKCLRIFKLSVYWFRHSGLFHPKTSCTRMFVQPSIWVRASAAGPNSSQLLSCRKQTCSLFDASKFLSQHCSKWWSWVGVGLEIRRYVARRSSCSMVCRRWTCQPLGHSVGTACKVFQRLVHNLECLGFARESTMQWKPKWFIWTCGRGLRVTLGVDIYWWI